MCPQNVHYVTTFVFHVEINVLGWIPSLL